MRDDGRLTRAEERTVREAIEILGEWVRAHAQDGPDRRPYGLDEINDAARALGQSAWTMFAGDGDADDEG